MQKKRLVYVIFLVLLASLVYAKEKELIISETVYQDLKTTYNGGEFKFTMAGYDSLYIKLPSAQSIIIRNESCEILENYDICVNHSGYWYHNATLDQDFYMAEVQIYEFLEDKAELNIERVITSTDLLIGEKTSITTVIQNIGEYKATNIFHEELIPPFFKISNLYGCKSESVNGSYVVKWTGNLLIDEDNSCSYTLEAQNNVSFESFAKVQFDDGVGIQNIESSETITVLEYQLNIEPTLIPENVILSQEFILELNISNQNSEHDINMQKFEVTIPPNIEIIEYPKLWMKNGKTMTWDETIDSQESQKFYLKLKATARKNFTIKPKAVYSINKVKKENELVVNFDLTTNSLIINSTTESIVESGNISKIQIGLSNPNVGSSFAIITVTIDSTIPNFQKVSQEIPIMYPLDSKIIDLNFTIPDIQGNSNHTLKIITSYKLDDGEIVEQYEEKIINVMGSPVTVEINVFIYCFFIRSSIPLV